MHVRTKALAGIVAAGTTLALVGSSAGAITDGQPDGELHPNVGLVLFYQEDGRFRCSGTLASPTVVVTAAHCTFGDIGQVLVTFDTDIAQSPAEAGNVPRAADDTGDGISQTGFTTAPEGWFLGTPATHPEYSDFTDLDNWNDTGVVVLEEPIVGITPATLAPTNYLDQFGQPALNHTLFEVVGYGTHVAKPEEGPQMPTPQRYPLIRRYTTSPGQKLTPQILQLNGNGNDNRGGGGTCFGDSGGPVFLNGFLVGDTSYGYTANCRYLGGYQRVDIPVVQDWLATFGL